MKKLADTYSRLRKMEFKNRFMRELVAVLGALILGVGFALFMHLISTF